MAIDFLNGLVNSMSWTSMCEQVGFNSAMAEKVKQRLACCKDDMASVCLLDGNEGKPTPLKFIAKGIGHLPQRGETELQKRVEHYLDTVEEATSGKTYTNLWYQLMEDTEEEIISW